VQSAAKRGLDWRALRQAAVRRIGRFLFPDPRRRARVGSALAKCVHSILTLGGRRVRIGVAIDQLLRLPRKVFKLGLGVSAFRETDRREAVKAELGAGGKHIAIDLPQPQATQNFYRDACCNTGREDMGLHTVCVVMTAEFLAFSKARGNDLSTPMPAYGFAGVKPGDRWCLCAARWKEALDAGMAPQVVLEATHAVTLQIVPLEELKKYAVRLQ